MSLGNPGLKAFNRNISLLPNYFLFEVIYKKKE